MGLVPFSLKLTTKEHGKARRAAQLETERTGRTVSAASLLRRGGMPLVERVLARQKRVRP